MFWAVLFNFPSSEKKKHMCYVEHPRGVHRRSGTGWGFKTKWIEMPETSWTSLQCMIPRGIDVSKGRLFAEVRERMRGDESVTMQCQCLRREESMIFIFLFLCTCLSAPLSFCLQVESFHDGQLFVGLQRGRPVETLPALPARLLMGDELSSAHFAASFLLVALLLRSLELFSLSLHLPSFSKSGLPLGFLPLCLLFVPRSVLE